MLPFVSKNNDASILVSDLSSEQCEEFDQDPPEPDGGLGGGAAAEPFSLFLVVHVAGPHASFICECENVRRANTVTLDTLGTACQEQTHVCNHPHAEISFQCSFISAEQQPPSQFRILHRS